MPSRTREEDLEIDAAPTSINPYEVLSIDKDVTADQVKSAYRKAALKYHPDKAAEGEKEAAHTKFQEIAFAYAVLSDERRRKRYDATGNTSESLDIDDDDFDWTSFFREQFENVVNEDAINKFSEEYKGSAEERSHVLQAYERHKGNMEKLYEDVMLSDMLEDEDRFRAIIRSAIEAGDVEAFRKFTDESEAAREKRMERARKKKAKEAKEAAQAEKEMDEDPKSKKNRSKAKKGAGDMSNLAALIQSRQKDRSADFLAGLEAKYAGDERGKKGKKRGQDEPSEEVFAKNRKVGKSDVAAADAGTRRSKRSRKV